MKKSRYSDSQILAILKQAEAGTPVPTLCREQAYLKHTILRTYLQRLFMIVGRGKETVINYVDCFAGTVTCLVYNLYLKH